MIRGAHPAAPAPAVPSRAKRLGAAALAVFSLLLWPGAARAADWQADVSVSFSEGDYGGDGDTTMFYVPLMLKRIFRSGDVSVTVPFIYLKSATGAVPVDGRPQSDGTGQVESASGLGDVVLKGKYYAVEQEGALPYLDLVARVKLPTADEDRGLGSGQPDFGLGAEASWRFGRNYFLSADVSYTIVGDPAGVNYENRAAWNAGLGWEPVAGLTLAAYYDYRGPLQSGDGSARTLQLYAARRYRRVWRLYALAELGLSDAAADFGLTIGLRRGFRTGR